MRTRLAVAFCFVSAFAFAETWSGTLVDAHCSTKDVAKHTKKCAMGCKSGGYGIVLSDGKFVKFNEAGNTKAVAALEKTTKEADLKATVSGKLEGETIAVDSINIQ